MKTSNKQTNTIVIMFWSLPSCTMIKAYKAKCDILNEAIREVKAVEVVTIGNRILRLKRIGKEAGRFFGREYLMGNIKKMHLNINEIKMVTLI